MAILFLRDDSLRREYESSSTRVFQSLIKSINIVLLIECNYCHSCFQSSHLNKYEPILITYATKISAELVWSTQTTTLSPLAKPLSTKPLANDDEYLYNFNQKIRKIHRTLSKSNLAFEFRTSQHRSIRFQQLLSYILQQLCLQEI